MAARARSGAPLAEPFPMISESTFHPDTRALLSYSRALAGVGKAPSGASADRLVERLFVIEESGGAFRMRTAGAELEALFGSSLMGADMLGFLPEPQRPLLRAFIGAVSSADLPGVVVASAETRVGRRLAVEILITPLRAIDADRRCLGLFQPLGGEPFIRNSPIVRVEIGALYAPEAKRAASLRLVVSN